MSTSHPGVYNVSGWIQENEKFFLPPVCNKMMHSEGQMKLFFVGGPNQRKDYHIECGEELFYMKKGDMVLKVVEKGQHRDVHIKEGQMFLLPARIAHSPQRQANTVGLVIERERAESELDGLRYFVETDGVATLESLYEEWFHCTDLGSQLAPVIKRYFASAQHRTGVPIPGTVPEVPPVILDNKRSLNDPFQLSEWIAKNKDEISSKGRKKIFEGNYQFQVFIYGQGQTEDVCDVAETWIWQLEGDSTLTMNGEETKMSKDTSVLIPKGCKYVYSRQAGTVALLCYQDPTKV